MSNQSFGLGSPKSFNAYPKGEFDLESGNSKARRTKGSVPGGIRMLKSFGNQAHFFYKLHPVVVSLILLFIGVIVLIVLSLHESQLRMIHSLRSYNSNLSPGSYPFANLHNLVMVAGHSIYTSSSCGKVDLEDSWFLEPYQKNPGQAATFLTHIKEGIEIAGKDAAALLLFSGGETRKNAGPRSEAQSYWAVAESKSWFGKQDSVRDRALTEEHARDSFENLLFSVCRFRELTGEYPHNITVVSYEFKEERFAHLHRMALGFPESRFFYVGTPASPVAREAAAKGEAAVRAQFLEDPYGCLGTLHQKRLGRDPFHRSIPYPSGCPELKGLFRYCGASPYAGTLPWSGDRF